MTIIISILKWLLLILLALLGLVIVLVACLLFVPARYYVYGQQDSTWSMRGNASWLLHILHFSFEVKKGEMQKTLRVFGIPVSLDGKKTKKRKRTKGKKQKKKANSQTAKAESVNEPPQPSKKALDTKKKEVWEGREDTRQSIPEKRKEASKKAEEKTKTKKDRKKKNSLSIKKVLAKIKKGIAMISRVFTEGPRAFIEGTKAEKIIEILQDSNTLELWRLIRANLVRLWRHSRPKRIKGRIHFGTGDPCTTGQLLGVIGAGFGALGSGVKVEPDFEEAVLDGYLEVKGRIQVYMLLWVLKDVFWSKEWKYFKRQKDQ